MKFCLLVLAVLFAPAPLPRRERTWGDHIVVVGTVFQYGHYKMAVTKIDGQRVWFAGYPHGSTAFYGGNETTVLGVKRFMKDPWWRTTNKNPGPGKE